MTALAALSFAAGYNARRAQTESHYYKKTHAVIVPGAHMVDDVCVEKAKRAEDFDFIVSYWVCDTPECMERMRANF